MYIQNIQQSTERMREMLNTLLNFFRLDNGKEQPNVALARSLQSRTFLKQSLCQSP